MKEVAKFFFVAALGIGGLRFDHRDAGVLQHTCQVVERSRALFRPELNDQPPGNAIQIG